MPFSLFGSISSGQLTAEVAAIPIFPSEPPASVICDPDGGVFVGFTKHWNRPFFYNPKHLVNPHMIVFGTSGAGKTTFVRTVLSRARITQDPPPNIIIIDTVGEYLRYVRSVGGVVYNIGGQDSLNPLDTPAPTLEGKIVQAVNMAAFSGIIEKKAPRERGVFREALSKAYERLGIRTSEDLADPSKRIPTLRDVAEQLKDMIEGETHSDRKRSAEAVYDRLMSVVGLSPALSRQSTIQLSRIFEMGMVELNLSPLPTEEAKTSAAILVLQYLVEWMRSKGETAPGHIRLFVVLDEAHRVFKFKMEEGESHPLAIIFREGRKYGVAAILSSQLVGDFGSDALANAATLVMFRVHRADLENLTKVLMLPRYVAEAASNLPTHHAMFLMLFRNIQWSLPIGVAVSPYFVKSDISLQVRPARNVAREILMSRAVSQ